MTTNLLNILIALGDTAVPVVIDGLKRKKDLAGRVEVSSKTYINHKKSIDALVKMVVDAVDSLANLPKDPTNEDMISFLRGIGDLERCLPLYPIDENALAPFTCGPEPIKYDVRDIVDEMMQDTILTLIKTTIKYSSLPHGLRNLTDDIIWKRMCALVSLLAELLGRTYNCVRNTGVEPPWVFNNNAFVARGTQIYLPNNFTVTLLDERKYFTEEEKASIREEENRLMEEEAKAKELMELEQQLPDLFTKDVLEYAHSTWDVDELIKMIKHFLAFFQRTSMSPNQLLHKLSSEECSLVDLFYTVPDYESEHDTVRYADVGDAFKLFDAIFQKECAASNLAVHDTDNGNNPVYARSRGLYDSLFATQLDNPVPNNWMLTIKVK